MLELIYNSIQSSFRCIYGCEVRQNVSEIF